MLTTPLMTALRERYPEARFTWITTRAAAPLLKHDPWIDEVLPLEKRGKGIISSVRSFSDLRAELQAREFDHTFAIQRSMRTALLLWSAGCKSRTCFQEARLKSLFHRSAEIPRDRSQHEVLRNLAILNEQRPYPLRLISPPELLNQIANLPNPQRSIVLGVGSAWATKRWTLGGFVAVARWVAAHGYIPVLLGGPEDRARAEIVAEQVPQVVITPIVSRWPLDVSSAFVAQCRAVVCHDSLLLHMAAAHHRPTVALFCSTIPEFGFGPWQNPNAQVCGVSGLACRPCGRHGHQRCPTGTWACALQLNPADVIVSLEQVLTVGDMSSSRQ